MGGGFRGRQIKAPAIRETVVVSPCINNSNVISMPAGVCILIPEDGKERLKERSLLSNKKITSL